MEASIEKLDGNQIKVTATVPAADVDAKLKSVYKELAGKYNFPGFRKGKAPRRVIDNALGSEVAVAQATEDVVNDAYPEIIEAQGLFPVGTPDFSGVDAVEAGSDFTFSFTIGTKPEVELTSYDAIEIEVPPAGVTDEEIDSEVEYMTRHYETYSDAAATAKLSAKYYADLDITAKDADGNAIDVLTDSKQFFAPGGGLFSEAFEKEVFGMKKGEERSFDLEVAEDEEALLLSDLAGKTISFDVKCIVVKKKTKPELTDEWVKENLNFDTLEDLRSEIASAMTSQKEQIMPRIKENACKVALVERVTDDVPENMVEEAESDLLQDFFTQLQQQGMTFDAYLAARGIDNDQFKQDVKRQAEDEAKEQLALDAWARKKGIEVTEDDVREEFVRAGLKDADKMVEDWRKSGRLYLIREGISRRKAMDDVMETAKVTEVEPKGDKKGDK